MSSMERQLTEVPDEYRDLGPDDFEVEIEIPSEEDEEAAIAMESMAQFEEHGANLADFMEEAELEEIVTDLTELYEDDLTSREEWQMVLTDGIELLGFKLEDRNDPFPGACGASHPMLAKAVVNFQAKSYKELFPVKGPVRTAIVGLQTPEKQAAAKRVADLMNYQCTEEMTEFAPELDRMLFYLGLYGSAFKKTYYDANLQRPVSMFVKSEDFVIDYHTSDLASSERFTHRMTMTNNKLLRQMAAGTFSDIYLDDSPNVEVTDARDMQDELEGRTKISTYTDDAHEVLEMHVNLYLGEDGSEEEENELALPYIVTFIPEQEVVLAIRRNWVEGDETFKKKEYFTHYCMIPGLGFYGYGYMHLIGGLSKTATSTLRQLMDAGTFANLPAGFKSHGLRVLNNDEPIRPGVFQEVNAPAGDLSKALIPLPFKEPSPTLVKLLEFVVGAGEQFADATTEILKEMTNYGPVGTTMALLEQSTQLYSAIHKRLHAAQRYELRILARINFEYLPDSYPFEVIGAEQGAQTALRKDFDPKTVTVIPVSDPNIPSETHRIAKMNAVHGLAVQDPSKFNMSKVYVNLLKAMEIDDAEGYMAQQEKPLTANAIQENAAALMGKPIASAYYQFHDGHIQSHASMLSNPAYADHQGMRQILMGHINEHLAQKYTMEILSLIGDEQLSQAVMAGEPLPPELEYQVDVKVAEVSDKLIQLDEVKAEIIAGTYEDPGIEAEKQVHDLELRKQDHKEDTDWAKIDQADSKIVTDDVNKDADRIAGIRKTEIQSKAMITASRQGPSK